jgi:hypothetical protein
MRSDLRRSPLRLSALMTIALSLVMTACGGSDGSTGSVSGNATDAAPEEFGLPLPELTTRVEATERLIADCMTSAGFDYVALDFVTIHDAMALDKSAPGVSDEDYVKQFGLGITTQFDKPLVVFGAGPDNNAALTALAESDQVAYRRALWGETPEWNHVRALEEEDFSQTGGCLRRAAEQTYTSAELTGTYVNPADVLLEQDSRMIAAIGAWSDCMRADGFDYEHPDRVEEDLQARLDAITQGQDPSTLTGSALQALQQLQGEEIDIATLLTTCAEAHIEPVQAQLESELYGGPQP